MKTFICKTIKQHVMFIMDCLCIFITIIVHDYIPHCDTRHQIVSTTKRHARLHESLRSGGEATGICHILLDVESNTINLYHKKQQCLYRTFDQTMS